MSKLKDGARASRAGAWRRRDRIWIGQIRKTSIVGIGLAICQAIQPTIAVGSGGAAPSFASTAFYLAANRPLMLDERAPEATLDLAHRAAPAANRPICLSLDEASHGTPASALGVELALGPQVPESIIEPPGRAIDEPGDASHFSLSDAPSRRAPLSALRDAAAPSTTLALAPGVQVSPPSALGDRATVTTGPGRAQIQSIRGGDEFNQRLTIAKNSTIVVELKSNVDRAEVADPKVADVVMAAPNRLILIGVGFGATQLNVWAGSEQTVFEVVVELDLSRLRDLIKMMAPTSTVTARSVNGTIVLNGAVSDATTAERIVQMASLFEGGKVQNQLDVAGVQQTLLRVTVAEVNKEAIRELGVNWAIGASPNSRDFFFANNVNQINPTVFGSNGLRDVRHGDLTYAVNPTANGPLTNVTFGFPRAEFQMFVNALRENQLFRILAEPNLVAISGQTATFLAGGEVPIPVTQGGAVAGAIVIEYKEFGVRLAFTPTVQAGQIIRLHIMSEISDAVPGTAIIGGLPVFSFTTRRVESTIECGNGQSFAIAGLLNERIQAIASKLPGLGDLPVLGALFSSVNYRKSNTELVVLVTPQLVAPLDPQQVSPAPGALMTPPNDFELFGLGQLEGPPSPPPEYNRVPREERPAKVFPGGTSWATTQMSLRGPWGLAEEDLDTTP